MKTAKNNFKKYFLLLLFFITACALLIKGPNVDYVSTVETKNEKTISNKDSVATITITAVGDLMCHSPQYNNAKTADGKYDFNPSFAEVKKFLSFADFTIGNLETTCAGAARGYSGYPNFNTPDEYVEALQNAGFDFLVTANNHSMDTEKSGLLRTIDIVTKNKMGYTGTFKSQRDRDSIRIVNLKGIRVGFLNYTYGTNGLLPSAENKFMLNVIDTILIKNDIVSARKKGAEVVIVYVHYGKEYISEPVEAQRLIVQKAIAYGADIILGAHTHVLSPVEYFKGQKSKLDSGFAAWSLGNFFSNQYKRYTDAGVMLNFSLTKNFLNDSIYISDINFIPTWVYRGTNKKRKMHIIFPSEYCLKDSLPDYLSDSLKKKMKEAFEDTKEVITKKSARIKMQSVK